MPIISSAKLIIAGVILAVIALGVGIFIYEHHEVQSLTQANATDKVTIADQATSVSEAHATVVNQIKSADITEATQLQAASETAATNTTVSTIVDTRKNAETAIDQAYSQIPVKGKTPAKAITVGKTTIDTSKISQADALSLVRVKSMWQVYCQLNPGPDTASDCAANQ